MIADLAAQGSLPLPFYPSFVESDDPASGFDDGVPPPRFSHGYFQLRNRFGHAGRNAFVEGLPAPACASPATPIVAAARPDRRAWRALAAAGRSRRRARGQARPDKPVALDYKATDKVRTIDFRGYAYTRTPSDVSGALMTRYDESKPQIWNIPLRDESCPTTVSPHPRPAISCPPRTPAWVGAKLRAARHRLPPAGSAHGARRKSRPSAPTRPTFAAQVGRRPPAPDARRRVEAGNPRSRRRRVVRADRAAQGAAGHGAAGAAGAGCAGRLGRVQQRLRAEGIHGGLRRRRRRARDAGEGSGAEGRVSSNASRTIQSSRRTRRRAWTSSPAGIRPGTSPTTSTRYCAPIARHDRIVTLLTTYVRHNHRRRCSLRRSSSGDTW